MLYLSLVLSAILLALANAAAWRRSVSWGFGCVAAVILIGSGLAILPPVVILIVTLGIALFVWHLFRIRPRYFLPASCLGAVLVFGVAWKGALAEQRRYAQLREEFPYDSLEERLPTPNTASVRGQFPEDARERLAWPEWVYDQGRSRTYDLRRLHEGMATRFANSQGFGVSRMSPRLHRERLTYGLRPDSPVPQLEPRESSAWPEGAKWQAEPPDDDLHRTHELSVVDFANPLGFGFLKDRRHVAGFQSHRFSQIPEPAGQWEVRRVDLIGLLLHGEPVAYVSDHLPRMDELRKAPTRSLDRFEAAGLETLRQGEDLVVGTAGGHARMVGAIRAARQCVQCHDAQRGDLLGAFSYSLRRTER